LADIGYRNHFNIVAARREFVNLPTGLAKTHDAHPDGLAF
jgi:hypothetical protein